MRETRGERGVIVDITSVHVPAVSRGIIMSFVQTAGGAVVNKPTYDQGRKHIIINYILLRVAYNNIYSHILYTAILQGVALYVSCVVFPFRPQVPSKNNNILMYNNINYTVLAVTKFHSTLTKATYFVPEQQRGFLRNTQYEPYYPQTKMIVIYRENTATALFCRH